MFSELGNEKRSCGSLVNEHKLAILFIAISLLHLLYQLLLQWERGQEIFDVYCYDYYCIDYGLTFGPRLLGGTIFGLLFPTRSAEPYIVFVSVFLAIYLVLIAIISERAVKKSEASIRPFTTILVLAFLISPVSISFFAQTVNFGRFDLILFIIAILCCISVGHKNWVAWVIILSLIAMLIHEGYLFFSFPLIVLVMMYNLNSDANISFRQGILIVLIVGSMFVILSKIPLTCDFDTMVEYAQSHSEITILPEVYEEVYYYTISEELAKFGIGGTFWTTDRLIMLGLTVILNAPIFYVFMRIWFGCYKLSTEKWRRITYLCCMLSPLIIPIMMLIASDWNRWFACAMLTQFLMLLYLLNRQDGVVQTVVRPISEYIQNHKPVVVVCLVYVFLLGIFASISFQDSVVIIYEGIW